MASRPTSPAGLPRQLFLSHHHDPARRASKLAELSSSQQPPRSRLSSLSVSPDPFTAHPTGSGSFVTYEHDSPVPSASLPPLATLPKRSRGSLLLAASSLPFTRPKSRSKKKAPPPPSTSPFLYSTEIIDISAARSKAEHDDNAERDRLRDAAAQSIGIDPILLEEAERNTISTPVPEQPFAVQLNEDELGAATISSSTTPTVTACLPLFPATRSALDPYVQLATRLSKHYPSHSLLKLALARQWKPRVLLLTGVSGRACLHVFKGATSEEHELERLEIGADSVVFIAEEDVGGRRPVVKVGSGGEGAQEMTLHTIDQAEAQNWITAIKHAVLSQRSLRAGLGAVSMTHTAGVFEPRGDLDVMLSMRAQGMLPSPTESTFAPEVHSPITPTATPAPTPTPVSNYPASSPSPAPRPSSTVSALRGLFLYSRPQSPATSEGGEDMHEDSFSRAGTSLLNMLRSGSALGDRSKDFRTSTTSPTLELNASLTPTFSAPSTPVVQIEGFGLGLDRKILQEEELEKLEAGEDIGEGNTNASIATDEIEPTFGFAEYTSRLNMTLHGGQSSMSTIRSPPSAATSSPSLQPPPRRRAYTTSVRGPMGSRARSDANGTNTSENTNGHTNGSANAGSSGLATPSYIQANASTAESLGVVSRISSKPANGQADSTNGYPTASGRSRSSSQSNTRSPPQSSPQSLPQDRGRRSMSSVSSHEQYASSDAGHGRASSRRWSHQGTWQRFSPPPFEVLPSGPREVVLGSSPGSSSDSVVRKGRDCVHWHPYAADAHARTSNGEASRTSSHPASRSSSMSVQSIPQSFVLNLREFSRNAAKAKRASASGSSVRSIGASSVNSVCSGGARPGSSGGHPNGNGSAVVDGAMGNGNGTVKAKGKSFRPRSSHRTSLPPPQHPAPVTALPPTPADEQSSELGVSTSSPKLGAGVVNGSTSRPQTPTSAPATKTTFGFRESLGGLRSQNQHRMSMFVSSTTMGRHSDEIFTSSSGSGGLGSGVYGLVKGSQHRRSSSSGSRNGNRDGSLFSIPASPVNTVPSGPPFPPPNGPLPPTPEGHASVSQAHTQAQAPALPAAVKQAQAQHGRSRSASLRQRLRILSAPGPAPAADTPPSPTPSTVNPYSIPSTPIGEPIMDMGAWKALDAPTPIPAPLPYPLYPIVPSLAVPLTPQQTRGAPDPEPSPDMQGVTSLSPPPRRGSRRISCITGAETPSPESRAGSRSGGLRLRTAPSEEDVVVEMGVGEDFAVGREASKEEGLSSVGEAPTESTGQEEKQGFDNVSPPVPAIPLFE